MEWGRSLEEAHLRVDRLIPGVSERIKRACRNYNVRVVYRSGPTLLIKVKDPLSVSKLSNVVYEIPCDCRKVRLRGDWETRTKALELPDCWITTLRRRGAGSLPSKLRLRLNPTPGELMRMFVFSYLQVSHRISFNPP